MEVAALSAKNSEKPHIAYVWVENLLRQGDVRRAKEELIVQLSQDSCKNDPQLLKLQVIFAYEEWKEAVSKLKCSQEADSAEDDSDMDLDEEDSAVEKLRATALKLVREIYPTFMRDPEILNIYLELLTANPEMRSDVLELLDEAGHECLTCPDLDRISLLLSYWQMTKQNKSLWIQLAERYCRMTITDHPKKCLKKLMKRLFRRLDRYIKKQKTEKVLTTLVMIWGLLLDRLEARLFDHFFLKNIRRALNYVFRRSVQTPPWKLDAFTSLSSAIDDHRSIETLVQSQKLQLPRDITKEMVRRVRISFDLLQTKARELQQGTVPPPLGIKDFTAGDPWSQFLDHIPEAIPDQPSKADPSQPTNIQPSTIPPYPYPYAYPYPQPQPHPYPYPSYSYPGQFPYY
ncbi:uncharacterized protein BYT42DRAFT_238277 [Radiomyces spectabilis]|uniref:uncharacterized protein n=1 Tax=Radiomyces spectabilis TaxID=64574 RepID=UPI00221E62F5|nr:uncharacterized protein BYT42DRAFT_238277 [Radiomyces spectabilis]KAI8388528.1 hypothetical protein BYT42DRAFT_238277 [Radiomyces spectabilis]